MSRSGARVPLVAERQLTVAVRLQPTVPRKIWSPRRGATLEKVIFRTNDSTPDNAIKRRSATRDSLGVHHRGLKPHGYHQLSLARQGIPEAKHHALARTFLSFLLIGLLALVSGCRRDMFYQPKGDPLKPSDFFADGGVSRPLVSNTIAVGHLRLDQARYDGMTGTNLVTTFPYPVTSEMLARGRERFEINCSPCHGRTGNGNGMIVQRGFPKPPSYHIDRLRQAPVGHFYHVITHGYGVMYSYAERVNPDDRWAIVAYIRALQLSRNATIQDVPQNQQAKLQGIPK